MRAYTGFVCKEKRKAEDRDRETEPVVHKPLSLAEIALMSASVCSWPKCAQCSLWFHRCQLLFVAAVCSRGFNRAVKRILGERIPEKMMR